MGSVIDCKIVLLKRLREAKRTRERFFALIVAIHHMELEFPEYSPIIPKVRDEDWDDEEQRTNI